MSHRARCAHKTNGAGSDCSVSHRAQGPPDSTGRSVRVSHRGCGTRSPTTAGGAEDDKQRQPTSGQVAAGGRRTPPPAEEADEDCALVNVSRLIVCTYPLTVRFHRPAEVGTGSTRSPTAGPSTRSFKELGGLRTASPGSPSGLGARHSWGQSPEWFNRHSRQRPSEHGVGQCTGSSSRKSRQCSRAPMRSMGR
jgi:hypothetical protein